MVYLIFIIKRVSPQIPYSPYYLSPLQLVKLLFTCKYIQFVAIRFYTRFVKPLQMDANSYFERLTFCHFENYRGI